MRSAFLAAAVAVGSLLVASSVRANGRFPASNAIAFSPTKPETMILRTTYGFLPSADYGTTWTWLCEDALGLPPTSNEDPNMGLTSNDSVVVGISLGLEVSPDTGCTWAFVPGLQGQNIKDLVVRPDAPHTVLALTSTYEADAGGADGGELYSQHVYVSTDDGAHWAQQGVALDPTTIATTIEVAAGDPQRIYVSTFRDVVPRTVSLFVSTDGAASWTEYPTPALNAGQETATYIAAVDPTNEDVIYLRTEGASRLFVSKDGGKSFQAVYSLDDQMLGFALSQDGTKVFLGGPNTGLFMASSTALQFTQVSPIHVQCLATHGADLWACSDEVSGFVAGVSQDNGTTFTAKLHLDGISGPIACGAGATAAQCSGAPFASTCSNLGGCTGPEAGVDAGPAEGGTVHETPVTAAPKSSCGCSVVGGGGAAGGVAAGLALLALARRRRRR